MTGDPVYRVRVVFHGSILHLMTRGEPMVRIDPLTQRVAGVEADWITGGWKDGGDRLGYVNWAAVEAISWRRCE